MSELQYIILLSRQGKVRLSKWFTTAAPKDRVKTTRDVTSLVLARKARMCNFLEYKDSLVIYRRYASLFFITSLPAPTSSLDTPNPLITLELLHRYVLTLDKYFGNVCELDIIFNFQKAYHILDELIQQGEMVEPGKKAVLGAVKKGDEEEECSLAGISVLEAEAITKQLREAGFV